MSSESLPKRKKLQQKEEKWKSFKDTVRKCLEQEIQKETDMYIEKRKAAFLKRNGSKGTEKEISQKLKAQSPSKSRNFTWEEKNDRNTRLLKASTSTVFQMKGMLMRIQLDHLESCFLTFFEGINTKIEEKVGLVNTICETYFGKMTHLEKRKTEERNLEEIGDLDRMFFGLCGTTVPRHIILEILGFYGYSSKMLYKLGSLNSDWYLLVLSSWKPTVKIRETNIHIISLLVLRNMKQFELMNYGRDYDDTFSITRHLFDNFTPKKIQAIYFSDNTELEDLEKIFNQLSLKKRNFVFPNCEKIGFGTIEKQSFVTTKNAINPKKSIESSCSSYYDYGKLFPNLKVIRFPESSDLGSYDHFRYQVEEYHLHFRPVLENSQTFRYPVRYLGIKDHWVVKKLFSGFSSCSHVRHILIDPFFRSQWLHDCANITKLELYHVKIWKRHTVLPWNMFPNLESLAIRVVKIKTNRMDDEEKRETEKAVDEQYCRTFLKRLTRLDDLRVRYEYILNDEHSENIIVMIQDGLQRSISVKRLKRLEMRSLREHIYCKIMERIVTSKIHVERLSLLVWLRYGTGRLSDRFLMEKRRGKIDRNNTSVFGYCRQLDGNVTVKWDICVCGPKELVSGDHNNEQYVKVSWNGRLKKIKYLVKQDCRERFSHRNNRKLRLDFVEMETDVVKCVKDLLEGNEVEKIQSRVISSHDLEKWVDKTFEKMVGRLNKHINGLMMTNEKRFRGVVMTFWQIKILRDFVVE